MFKKILIANDGSEGAKKALRAALALAKTFGAEIQSISIKERPSHYAETVGEVMEEQEEADRFYRPRQRRGKSHGHAGGAGFEVYRPGRP